MKRFTILLLVTAAIIAPTLAGERYVVYGLQVEDRASTRIGYWRTDVNAGIGEVVVSYGRPPWKQQYAEQLDQLTRGKMWRMGDNYWTLLDTNLPIQLGSKAIDPGLYYLAIHRSTDGAQWELVFIDPVKSRSKGLDSYDVGTRPELIPVLFRVPLKFEKAEEIADRLTILFSQDQDETRGLLRLSWGNFTLSTPISIQLPEEFR